MGKYIIVLLLLASPILAQLKVVTSTPNQTALVREIAGDLVVVESICKPYEDQHFVDVSPVYMVQLRQAQLFVETGLDAEPWVTPLLEGSRNAAIQRGALGHVDASQGIQTIEVPTSTSRVQGDVHALGNPHYLLDPVNSKKVAHNIYQHLVRLDPANAEVYKKNLIAYNKRLRASLVKWLKKTHASRGEIKVVTYHRLWPYFLRRFGFSYINTIEAKPGIAPSSAHLESLIAQMKAENCKIIIVANWYSRKTADYIASKTGARVIYAPVEVGGAPEVNSYLQLFDHLLEEILKAKQ